MKSACVNIGKDRIVKKIMIFVIVLMLFASPAVAAAEATDTIEVHLDNIEELILESSPDLKIIKNNLSDLQADYKEIEAELSDLTAKFNMVDINEPNGWQTLTSLWAQIEALRSQRDSAKYNMDLAKIKYSQQVSQLCLSAGQMLVNCLSLAAQIKTAENSLNLQEKRLSDSSKKLAAGYITQKQYNELSDLVTEAEANLDKLRGQEDVAILKLNSALGLKDGAKLSIKSSNMDFSLIDDIDFEADTVAMLSSNADVIAKEYALNYEKSKPESNQTDTENAEVALEQAKDQAVAEFTEAYHGLLSTYALTVSAEKDCKDKTEDFRIKTLLFDKGLISKKQLEDAELELKNLEIMLSSQKTNLYFQYLSYMSLKDGC
jgi:outer membrane protein TolC